MPTNGRSHCATQLLLVGGWVDEDLEEYCAPPRRPTRPGALGVVLLVALLLAAVLVALPRGRGAFGRAAVGPAPVAQHVVQPGDSWWSVADRLAPGEDPRAVVHELSEAHGPVPQIGQRVALP